MGIKVLHMIDSGGLYGAEAMLLDLVEEQLKQGMEPLILSAGKPDIDVKPLDQEARRRGLPIKPFKMKAGLNFRKGLEVLRFAQEEGFDILHSHGYKFNILLGSLPRRIRKLPLLTTVHGYVLSRPLSKMRFNQWLDRICLARMDAVVCVSAPTLRKTGLEQKHAVVINNGLRIATKNDTDTTTEETDQMDARLARAKFVIAAFGRLTPEKGLEDLISAFIGFRVKISDAVLVIWGEGGLRYKLQAIIQQNGLSDSILLPGYTGKVSHYMKSINMLALPSLTEGLPVILLEAMHNGVPVVASKVGAIPEVLEYGECGVLVNPGEPESLAAAMERIYNDHEGTQARVNRARTRVKERYSSKMMADKYMAVYNELLACK
jgi:glycosyltransferase involved in cell wall biosynthesis